MKSRTTRLPLSLVLVAALLPALGVAVRAAADEDDGEAAAKTAETPEHARKRVLGAMGKDPAALINVTGRELPASPDILAFGRRGTAALVRCLADNADEDVRRSCAAMLGFIGDRTALPGLQAALADWEPSVRNTVVHALGRIPDPSSIDPLVKLFSRKDEPANVRASVLAALGAVGHSKAVALLRKELVKKPKKADGEDEAAGEDLRTEAFDALWRSRHVMSRETLIGDVADALGSKKDPLVLAATLAAAELRAPRLTEKLVPLLDHGNAEIRNKAVYALGLIGDKTAEKALLEKLPNVRDGRMLNNIAFALERLDRDGFYASIRQIVEHKQAIIRLNGAFVLGDVKRPEGLPLLEKALLDPSDLVKTSAAVALGKIGDPRALPALEKVVHASNPSLREEAIYAVFAISGGKQSALVHDELFTSSRDEVKKRAALTLGKIGDTRVREYLLGCAERRKCRASQVDTYVHLDKDAAVGGRILLDWTRGRGSFTRFVADLRPVGALPLATSAAESAVSQASIDDAESAIDLVGELGDAESRARLGRLAAAPAMTDVWLQIHTQTALSRLGETSADAALLGRMDTIAAVWLPRFAGIVARISEKGARDRLTPELVKREKGGDPDVALAAAAIRLAWDPENAVFRLLEALGSPQVKERDLAERYLVGAKDPKVTWLLRRALAREARADVKDRLRALLDRRRDET